MCNITRIALFTKSTFAAGRTFLWARKRKLNALEQKRYDLKTETLPTYEEIQYMRGENKEGGDGRWAEA
jgi:hypothetical protein